MGRQQHGMNATTLEQQTISHLRKRILDECPNRGTQPPLNQKVSFRSLPLSEGTLRGLELGDGTGSGIGGSNNGSKNNKNNKKNGNGNNGSNNHKNKKKNNFSTKKQFWIMTDIQNACIPHALRGRDILGAARTGSGKTLAFLIPLLEKLYRRQYTPPDGPGAIVLSPTRELAVQTFQVLRNIGSFHHFSAGLLVGGKKEFGLEQRHVPKMNIVVATPGRLLQHLEQTAGLDVERVCMLVLDEADRILDMGFRPQMVRILDYLPPGNTASEDDDMDEEDGVPGRQTMLFSATQTKRVSDLAALSLHQPEYLGVHDKETSKTPKGLEQSVMIVPLHHKLNAVYSFIKSHLKCKTIIFFSSCSQVRHVWEICCTLQPGVPLMALHGKLKQETRTKLYFDFLQRPHAVLFATDVAARGLDFPNVDWVLQADAPEDVEMYIHRVGRTARYTSNGKALMLLTPQEEEGMTKCLDEAKISVKSLSMNPNKAVLVSKKAAAVVASSPDMNLLAKKAFKSYLRSVHLMPNKQIFKNVLDLPLEDYALSLGLASMPTVRFLKKLTNREDERKKKNVDYKLQKLKEEIKAERLEKKIAKLGSKKSKNAMEIMESTKKKDKKKKKKRAREDDDDDSEEDEVDDENLLVVKKVHEWGVKNEPLPEVHLDEASKSRHAKKIRIDGSSTGANKKIMFDDEGNVEEDTIHDMHAVVSKSEAEASATTNASKADAAELASAREEYLEKVRNRLKKTKELDKREEKERIQEKHKKRKMKERGDVGGDGEDGDDDDGDANVVTLGGQYSSDESSGGEDEGSESDSSDDEDRNGDGNMELIYNEDSDDDNDDDADIDGEVNVKAQEELALAMLGN